MISISPPQHVFPVASGQLLRLHHGPPSASDTTLRSPLAYSRDAVMVLPTATTRINPIPYTAFMAASALKGVMNLGCSVGHS